MFVYRAGTKGQQNLTPRPGDTMGLSTFDSVVNLMSAPGSTVKSGDTIQVNHQGLHAASSPWAYGSVGLEAELSGWYCSNEPTLGVKVSCSLSFWSNEYYLLAAVASFAVDGNPDDELVIEVGFHRNDPNMDEVDFAAEICRESGPPLHLMPSRRFHLNRSASISKDDMETALTDFHAFLVAQSPLILQQLAAISQKTPSCRE